MDKKIEIRTKDLVYLEWEKFHFIQPEGFKHIADIDFEKLKTNLKINDWTVPFIVWNSGGMVYCLDGYHRIKALKAIRDEGWDVPTVLPAIFIECKTKKEAAKMVLSLSAHYATVKAEILGEYFKQYDLTKEGLLQELHLIVNSEMVGEIPLENLDVINEYKEYFKDHKVDTVPGMVLDKAPTNEESRVSEDFIDGIDSTEQTELHTPRVIETSRVRMSALYYNQTEFEEFVRLCTELGKQLGTETIAETVLEVLRNWSTGVRK